MAGGWKGRFARLRAWVVRALAAARAAPFATLLAAVEIALLVVVAFVVSSERPEWALKAFGVAEDTDGGKSRVLEYLGIAMAGVLAAIGAAIANRRAEAMEAAARAQARAAKQQARANDNAEKGQLQDRLKMLSNIWATDRRRCAPAAPSNSNGWRGTRRS